MGIEILYAVLIAFTILVASWWSATSAFRNRGRLRAAQISTLVLVFLAMVMLGQHLELASQIVGGLLIFTAGLALLWETWQNKLFPVIHIAFGTSLVLTVPFNG